MDQAMHWGFSNLKLEIVPATMEPNSLNKLQYKDSEV